jgi:uncharacterized membrane protein YfcA
MTDPLLYVLCGFLVGALVGLTGVGGGSLMTPALVLLFGQAPATAVGTDLVFSATTKLVATASFGFKRRVDWEIVMRLLRGSIPACGAVIAWMWLTRHQPGEIDRLITRCLAVVLALTSAALLLQTPLRNLSLKLTAAWLQRIERYKKPLTIGAGLLLGAGVTLTSVGAGALGVAALLALYPLRLPADRLVATDIAHALPITMLAGASHALFGHVDAPVLGCLLAGSIPGVIIASRTAIRIPQMLTRTLIAIVLAVVSERLLAGF